MLLLFWSYFFVKIDPFLGQKINSFQKCFFLIYDNKVIKELKTEKEYKVKQKCLLGLKVYRLGWDPRLSWRPNLAKKIPIVQQQQEKFQPKMREILAKQAKMIAKWAHEKMTWKKLLMSWMVILVASKMVLLMLTYKYFTMTRLISLQVSRRLFLKRPFYLSRFKKNRRIKLWLPITF